MAGSDCNVSCFGGCSSCSSGCTGCQGECTSSCIGGCLNSSVYSPSKSTSVKLDIGGNYTTNCNISSTNTNIRIIYTI